jgi:hypothetical protein
VIFYSNYERQLYADTLNLQSQLSIITKKDRISVLLNISNKGPATAYDIVTRIIFLNELRESRPIHCLYPNFDEKISMEFDLQENMKGDYPLIIEIQFHDTNLYPFYSLRCSPIHIHSQKQKNSLNVHVPDIELSDQRNIGINIVNTDKMDKYISVQMIVPGAFSCEKNTQIRILAKSQTADIPFCILKKSALPGTLHNGYVLITYEDKSISHAQVKQFKIHVKPVARGFVFEKKFVAKTCIAFGLIWILFMTVVSFKPKKVMNLKLLHKKILINIGSTK